MVEHSRSKTQVQWETLQGVEDSTRKLHVGGDEESPTWSPSPFLLGITVSSRIVPYVVGLDSQAVIAWS